LPLLLPLLLPQLLTSTFTAPEMPLRLESFAAWHAFIDCCCACSMLSRKRQVLLSPVTFAFKDSSSVPMRRAALGAWGRLLLLLLGRRELLWVSSVAAAGAVDDTAAGGGQQEQQPCEGVSALAFDAVIKPVVELVMGYPPLQAAAAATAAAVNSKPDSGSRHKPDSSKDTSLPCGTPFVQFVLQEVLAAAVGAAASTDAKAKADATPQHQRLLTSSEMAARVLQLLATAVCGGTHAVAVLEAAADVAAGGALPLPAAAAAAAADGGTPAQVTPAAPAAAAAAGSAQKQADSGVFGLLGLHDTPPPSCTPLTPWGGAAAAPGGTPAPLGLLRLQTPGGTPMHQQQRRQSLLGPPTASEGTPQQQQQGLAPAVQADLALLLQQLPGWLQVCASAAQALSPAPSAGGEPAAGAVQQLVQAWLPAWQGLMRLLGACLLLQQRQAASSSGPKDGSKGHAADEQQAVAAAVQCLGALQAVVQVGATESPLSLAVLA
jgi:hypothetical protein